MKTKTEIKMHWKPTCGQIVYFLTIPKGTRVKATSHNQFFVDDLTWVASDNFFLYHDADHYGIRLNADQVE